MRLRLAAIAAAAATFVACSGGGGGTPANQTPVGPINGQLAVRAFDMGFDPRALLLTKGEQVQLVLTNDGSTLHDLKIDGLEADLTEKHSTGPLSGDEGELFVSASSGREATLTFVPRESGTFTFYCTISGHRQLGMEGTIRVE